MPRQIPSIGVPAGDELAEQLVEAELVEVGHGAREGPHAGQHEPAGRADAGGVAGDGGAHADVLERLLDRAAVAHPVVDDRQLELLVGEWCGSSLILPAYPSCSGTPCSLASSATAARSARAKALKAASIMWWALLPLSTRRWRVSLALVARARKNSSVSSWSKPPVEPSGRSASKSVNGPARDVDRGARPSLVHGHDGGPVAGDPGAVAERLIQRAADHDRGVLDGVVGAGLEVAGDGQREVEVAVAGEQVEHVVEEAHAGGARRRRRCLRAPARPGPGSRRCCARCSRRGSWLGRPRGGSCWLILADVRASIDSACTSKPSARAIGAPAAASFGRGLADPHLGHRAPEVPRARGPRRSGPRRRWGARGWSRRRSRRRRSRCRRR